jgi:hypothetical protein
MFATKNSRRKKLTNCAWGISLTKMRQKAHLRHGPRAEGFRVGVRRNPKPFLFSRLHLHCSLQPFL